MLITPQILNLKQLIKLEKLEIKKLDECSKWSNQAFGDKTNLNAPIIKKRKLFTFVRQYGQIGRFITSLDFERKGEKKF